MLLAGIQYYWRVKESWIPDQARNDGWGFCRFFTLIRDEPKVLRALDALPGEKGTVWAFGA